MKIIKRSGTEVVFDIDKIVNAIRAANLEVEESSRLTDRQVVYAAQNVAEACENAGHTVSVEEIQDLVEDEIMRLDCYEVARPLHHLSLCPEPEAPEEHDRRQDSVADRVQ